MNVLGATVSAPSRFDWVVRKLPHGCDDLFDRPLASSDVAVAIPSLGSLVQGWTLIVPRVASINMRELSSELRADIDAFGTQTAEVLEAQFQQPVWEFEHGPIGVGTATGCGVDQAHMHQVPLSFDLIERLLDRGHQTMELADSADPWAEIHPRDYWLIRNRRLQKAVVVYPTEPQSQGVRRIIAGAVGHDAAWNYRTHPMRENALATAAAFRA